MFLKDVKINTWWEFIKRLRKGVSIIWVLANANE